MAKAKTLRNWHGATASTIQQRIQYAIAARGEKSFAKAWRQLVSASQAGTNREALRQAIDRGSLRDALAAIPALTAASREQEAARGSVEQSYTKILEASAAEESDNLGFAVLAFALLNRPTRQWASARAKAVNDKYLMKHQRDILGSVLDRGTNLLSPFSADDLAGYYFDIAGKGLNTKDERAVWSLLNSQVEGGETVKRSLEYAKRYATTLGRRRTAAIAQSEAIEAEAQGIQALWREGQRQGLIEPKAAKEWVAAQAGTPCPICAGLDGTIVPLEEDFVFIFRGITVFKSGPTAHPQCVCTLLLHPKGHRERN